MLGNIQVSRNTRTESICTKRSKCNNYKKLNTGSTIDENLFGDPLNYKKIEERKFISKLNKNKEDVNINIFRNHKKQQNCPKEIVHGEIKNIKAFANDFVRKLVVPKEGVKEKTIILPGSVYQRIRNKAKLLSEADLNKAELLKKENAEKLLIESNDRKFEMKKLDMARKINEKLNDLEEEAKMRAQYLLTKAMEQRQEQDDDIKNLNEHIMNAKIQAIRDAQMLEKRQMTKEINEEENRLDNMMETERQNGMRIQNAIDNRKREEEMLGACEIMKQISENEQDRLLALERIEQENVEARRKTAADMLSEMERRIKKRAEQDELREELNKANTQMIQARLKEAEQDKLLNMKILQEQQAKAEREAAFEAEQQRIRYEKELETARLRGLQERASDEAAERDALRAKRSQEEAERQWRRKELEAAKKQAADRIEMNKERVKQSEDKKRLLAMEVSRERAEFERILKAQKDMIEKDKQEAEKKKNSYADYKNEIRRQICEKEQERIAERNAFFEEGVRMEEEARIRRLRLDDAKNRKLRELRDAGIPEKYLSQIERKYGGGK